MQHENIIILMIIFNFCMIQVYELQNVDIMQQLSKYRLTIKSVKFAFSAFAFSAFAFSALTLLTLKGPLNRCVCVCVCVCVRAHACACVCFDTVCWAAGRASGL